MVPIVLYLVYTHENYRHSTSSTPTSAYVYCQGLNQSQRQGWGKALHSVRSLATRHLFQHH